MAREYSVSRRTALKLTGAAASTALVAGCGGSGNGNGGNGGNGNGGGEGPFEISADTDIELRSLGTSWEGISPDPISGVENPDLSLTEGETYTIIWAENDTGSHNLAIYDSNEEAVEGPNPAQPTDEAGAEIEFEPSDETNEYVCVPHYSSGMAGSIEVSSGGGGSGNESGNESE